MATSLSQYGITWTFDGDYTTGQYANGDYYVVAPSGLTITEISPASTISGGRTINGSMVNPTAGTTAQQGFDSASVYTTYNSSLNVARPGGSDLSAGNPLVLSAGSSLVSSISNATAGTRPQLTDAAVLTVVASAPAANSFRPPYCGSDKSGTWNKSDLDYSTLRSLATVTGTPSLATVEAYFTRPWIEINTEHEGRYIHPSNNQPDYGADMAEQLGSGLLSLHLNYTTGQKETLLVRLAQYGIDLYGAAVSGAYWKANGGHNLGRKSVLLLTAIVLDDAAMLAYADAAQHFIFQEDGQTWYVVEADVGRTLYTGDGRPREEYIEADVGLAEWGEKHNHTPTRDGRNFDAYYRDICSTQFVGHRLAMGLTAGAKAAWNWPAFFEYADRFVPWYDANDGDSGSNVIPAWHRAMWDAYWGLWMVPASPTATATGSSTIDLGWTDASSDETGFKIERSLNGSSGWTQIGTAAADATSYSDTGLSSGTAYYYRVRAYNTYGNSAYSASANDATDAAPTVGAGRYVGSGAAAMF